MFRTIALCALLATGVAASAPAIQSTPIPMSPKPDFSSMRFLTGRWRCTVRSSRRPQPFYTTSEARISPDGYWLVTVTTTHAASWIPRTYSGVDRVTYDPTTARWIDINYDEKGYYSLTTSPGWRGNAIVWSYLAYPHVDATARNYPTTMRRIGDARTVAHASFTDPAGRLIMATTTCVKEP
jgi:hypothetical protein